MIFHILHYVIQKEIYHNCHSLNIHHYIHVQKLYKHNIFISKNYCVMFIFRNKHDTIIFRNKDDIIISKNKYTEYF